MKHLVDIIQEGFFDYDNDAAVEKAFNKDMLDDFLKKKCKGNYKIVSFKDGSFRVNGKMILSGANDKEFKDFKCKDFHGKLIIENCPDLTTLEGSFLDKITVFDGSITINQCKSLESIKGIPEMVKGDVSITNCKKLKDLGTLESIFGNFYWEHNGKKFTDEQIRSKVMILKHTILQESEEEMMTEGLVMEAFNNPWLQRLAAQLKKYPYKEWSYGDDDKMKLNTVSDVFKKGLFSHYSNAGRLLDKITNDDIDVYDLADESDKKELGKVFYNTYSTGDKNGADIILLYKNNIKEFVGGYGYAWRPRGSQNAGIQYFLIPNKENTGRVRDGRLLTKSEARDDLLKKGDEYTAVVIKSGNETGTDVDSRWKIKSDRLKSQEGVINPGDIEQYKKIAADNLKRYKDGVAKIKAERKKSDAAEGYDKLIDEYEAINTRVIKLVRAIAKNPTAFEKYQIDNFLHWLRDERRSNPNYKSWRKDSGSPYYGENGLMYRFKNFMSCYLDCFGKSYFGNSTPTESTLKYLESAAKSLKDGLAAADMKLTKFGC